MKTIVIECCEYPVNTAEERTRAKLRMRLAGVHECAVWSGSRKTRERLLASEVAAC